MLSVKDLNVTVSIGPSLCSVFKVPIFFKVLGLVLFEFCMVLW